MWPGNVDPPSSSVTGYYSVVYLLEVRGDGLVSQDQVSGSELSVCANKHLGSKYPVQVGNVAVAQTGAHVSLICREKENKEAQYG